MDIEIIKAELSNANEIGYIGALSWQASYRGIVPDKFLADFIPEKRRHDCIWKNTR